MDGGGVVPEARAGVGMDSDLGGLMIEDQEVWVEIHSSNSNSNSNSNSM